MGLGGTLKSEGTDVNLEPIQAGLKKPKIMALGPVTSQQINGETVETVTDFYFLGLQHHCRC